MIAHVSGVPLEEILPLVSGAGVGLLLARAWLILHQRRVDSQATTTSAIRARDAPPAA